MAIIVYIMLFLVPKPEITYTMRTTYCHQKDTLESVETYKMNTRTLVSHLIRREYPIYMTCTERQRKVGCEAKENKEHGVRGKEGRSSGGGGGVER